MSTISKQAKAKIKTSSTSKINLSVISKLRINKGYSQEEFSILTGLTKNYISKIENNKANPRLSEILIIADVLGVDLKLSSKFNFLFEEKIKKND